MTQPWMLLAVATVTVAVALGGCARRPPPRLYVLAPAETGLAAEAPGRSQPIVGVVRVILPRYLDRAELVSRGEGHRLDIAADDRWAEPLVDGMQRSLAADLSRQLPQGRIATPAEARGASPPYEIRLDVESFEDEGDGSVALSGTWSVLAIDKRRQVASGTISRREPIAGRGHGAVVAALDRALDAASGEVASGLIQTAGIPPAP